jgi:hypothetical protein
MGFSFMGGVAKNAWLKLGCEKYFWQGHIVSIGGDALSTWATGAHVIVNSQGMWASRLFTITSTLEHPLWDNQLYRSVKAYGLMGHRRMWVMRFMKRQETCEKELKRYQNVQKQLDMWYNEGALVQWCFVMLARCSLQLAMALSALSISPKLHVSKNWFCITTKSTEVFVMCHEVRANHYGSIITL